MFHVFIVLFGVLTGLAVWVFIAVIGMMILTAVAAVLIEPLLLRLRVNRLGRLLPMLSLFVYCIPGNAVCARLLFRAAAQAAGLVPALGTAWTLLFWLAYANLPSILLWRQYNRARRRGNFLR